MLPKKGSSLGRKTKKASLLHKRRENEDEVQTQERQEKDRIAKYERRSLKDTDQEKERSQQDSKRASERLKNLKKEHIKLKRSP